MQQEYHYRLRSKMQRARFSEMLVQ